MLETAEFSGLVGEIRAAPGAAEALRNELNEARNAGKVAPGLDWVVSAAADLLERIDAAYNSAEEVHMQARRADSGGVR